MTEFPLDIKFIYPWRKYQQRVLDELQDHMADRHLHIIAPPGSGKTVLGLEVALRLNQGTLILAPTLAIRNQWIQRFCELFLQTRITPDWISRDIRKPGFMTVVTYQGLHAACNNLRINEEAEESEEEETEENGNGKSTHANFNNIVNALQSRNIKTIVIDEAHHLKNEWWQTLTKVKNKLDPFIVGLTATPPYDVSAAEWQRYIDLNGPVDTEISVPELIIEGDLCPHQDYVYFSLPTEREYHSIIDFRQNIEQLFREIKSDEMLVRAIENHPIWLDPTAHLEWIYSNLFYYSASLIFLNANEIKIPPTHLSVVGSLTYDIPPLDYEWLETLLAFYLYKERDSFKDCEEHQNALENRLRRKGAIERRQINFSHNKRLTGSVTSSISKLHSIKNIVDFEYQQLGGELRLVILSDYIRKDFFVNAATNIVELNKLGVIPIFEILRRTNSDNKKLGVLTGSIIILPKSAYSAFEAKAAKYGISNIISSPVPYDENYILIEQSEQLKHDIIHIITQIFQNGEIEVLIGTKSLLGEGWDAPAINSLILASVVGSFVQSNQMRGRAIRKLAANQEKTGNIWHLACLDPSSTTGGDDFEVLKRRFRTFVGVSFQEDGGIENGIGRLNLPKNIHHKREMDKKNEEMFALAGDRESLKNRWKKALATGVNLVEEIKIPFPRKREYKTVTTMYLNKTIGNMMASLTSGLMGFGLESLHGFQRATKHIKNEQEFYGFLAILGTIGVLFFGGLAYRTIRLYFKYRDIAKDIRKIGNALLNSLIKAKSIQTDGSKMKVETSVDNWGAVFCHLEGGTTFEKSYFINTLQEIIGPVANPRYVIIRKHRFLLFIDQKDYHSVPEVLGQNKNLAEYFKNQWQQNVGPCDLIFTRTLEGRKLLLRSRVKSLAAQFEDQIEHVNKWR